MFKNKISIFFSFTTDHESGVENMETNNTEHEIESNENLEPVTATNSNGYKVDYATEQQLLNINSNFDQNKLQYTFEVRPWGINIDSKKPIIDIMTQFALYKCMHPDCVYATDNEQHWETHMKKHIQMIDVLTKHLPTLANANRSKHIKFRECSYCTYMAKADFQVIAHMARHRRNAFQVCFSYPFLK